MINMMKNLAGYLGVMVVITILLMALFLVVGSLGGLYVIEMSRIDKHECDSTAALMGVIALLLLRVRKDIER